MKKTIIYVGMMAFVLFSCTLSAQAQSKKQQKQLAELMQELENFQDCFDGQSAPQVHDNAYHLGEVEVPVVEQTDFTKGAFHFSQVTPDLNVRVALVDDKNLSDWERRNARQICEEYFRGGPGFHIAAHGLEDPENAANDKLLIGGQELTPEQTADMIMQCLNGYEILTKYRKEPFPVVLHSCLSGEGENGFAAQLSEILSKKIENVAVIAAPNLVMCQMDNAGGYNEYIVDKAGHKGGRWNVFQNGRIAMQGTLDYKSTVSQYVECYDVEK
ncbi:MAG: hypothetical protein IJ635_11005 [Bacteroidaceae bacterium]|nr:hypothetical protein [Bacteroidaceae bacterium]